jgi:hypothetical protein
LAQLLVFYQPLPVRLIYTTTGNGDRAIEALLPGFIKQPIVAARYASDGARTLQGNIMKKEFTPFELMMQSLGITTR